MKRRIDRLEASGVIRGYTTVVDHAELGRPLEAFVELRRTGDVTGTKTMTVLGTRINASSPSR